MMYLNITRTQLIQCHSIFLKYRRWCFTIEKSGMRLTTEKLTTDYIKGEAKYMHSKLRTWKEHIKTNFHGQDVVKQC